MTKIGVLVSAYYAEQFLQGRLENLLEQEGVDLEILVACQADSAEHKIATGSWGAAVKVFASEGIPPLYLTWNLLIDESNTEFLTNANCDDRLYPGGLELLGEALDSHPDVAVAYADMDIVKEVDADPVGRRAWPQGGFDELVNGCFVGPMPMWRRSLHSKYGMFDSEMLTSGDYEFWLRITKAGEKILHVPQVTGAFTNHSDNLEYRQPLRGLWEDARARSRYVDWRTYGQVQED